MTTPLGSKKKKKGRKARINEHERELADKLGGIRQLQSGAMPGHKGDIKVDDFLLDSKETIYNNISVVAKDLTKITEEARGENRVPGLVLTLKTPIHVSSEWVAIPIDVFAEMIENAKVD